jgi:hypothetical protein
VCDWLMQKYIANSELYEQHKIKVSIVWLVVDHCFPFLARLLFVVALVFPARFR